ncbi:MAG: 50S ribosomal protein L23, partial [Clostridia bacterium]|nr:50S ribosomal protein L23 [Clostridia bacterium]
MKFAQDIILKPVITEKSMDGISTKRYTFEVAIDATKPEIAAAVEELFNVEVASVNTMIMKKK